MRNTTTINDIHNGIDPLQAALNAKGMVSPEVFLRVRANADLSVSMFYTDHDAFGEPCGEHESFYGSDFKEVLSKAIDFINNLPSPEQAKLHNFMRQLGHLIDAGKSAGIEIEYLNPLIASMKTLSENVITHRPGQPA